MKIKNIFIKIKYSLFIFMLTRIKKIKIMIFTKVKFINHEEVKLKIYSKLMDQLIIKKNILMILKLVL
jgi:hypothetical protein